MSELMTCVFPMSKENPFDVETPFGRPLVIARGDVTAERDKLEEQRDALLTALEELHEDALRRHDEWALRRTGPAIRIAQGKP